MDSYALGKDIQDIKDRLERIEERLAGAPVQNQRADAARHQPPI